MSKICKHIRENIFKMKNKQLTEKGEKFQA